MKIIKRDGRIVDFNIGKINKAITASLGDRNYLLPQVPVIASTVKNKLSLIEGDIGVESIQDIIISILKEMDLDDVAINYKSYRDERTRIRDTKSSVMNTITKISTETERDNANVGNNFSSKLLQIASVANKWANLAKMPKKHAKLHEKGDYHIHDLDSMNLTLNCLNIDTGNILNKGFNTGYGTIRKPNSVESAGELSCIILQSSQNDCFGGQAHINFDNDMAPYVEKTRKKITDEYINLLNNCIENRDTIDEKEVCIYIEKRVEKSVRQAMQGVCYNLNTMHSRAGSQVPFSSLNIGLPESDDAALVCRIFLEEYAKGMGKGEPMIFPNIIFRIKKGVNAKPGDPYYYLRQLAVKTSAKRMNPTYRLLDSSLNLPYYERGIIPATMGCRTNVLENINGPEGPAKRGNIAPISFNMPRIGIESKGDWHIFRKKLNDIMEACYDQLMYRFSVLEKLKVKDLPFVAGEKLIMGSENLSDEDSIKPILENGTWAVGFIGLAETLVAMMGCHHGQSKEAEKKADEIMNFMYAKVQDFKKRSHLNFGLYASPAEGLCGRFVSIDKEKYGIIEGVTDKGYYTNSFHIPVEYNISATKKADIEGKWHTLCSAGHISYFQIDGGTVEEKEAYINKHLDYCIDHTDQSYVGYNFHELYCKKCGYDLSSVGLEAACKCPKCKSIALQGVSRVTGYMSLDERFGPGKVAERAARVNHKL